ncbi:transglutaminase-like cysteine peptidase [Mesorhizobium sp. VNQ89]|uniref:transglutaminase-like cysteine peptidase n=1 Tax=Mesorhizobium quangtriensis TaxID=3157709 RepID=UPI0032B773FB
MNWRAAFISMSLSVCWAGLSFNYAYAGDIQTSSISSKVSNAKPLAYKWQVKRKPSKGSAAAPLAYQLYCLQNAADCRNGKAKSASVQLTSSRMSQLRAINAQVNRSIRPRNDRKGDRWVANPTSGDCEDYALTKRKHLIRLGFPQSALRIAVVRTSRGEGHAVLVVKTPNGDRILDNRTNSIRGWGQTDLTLVKMASANPLRWE